MLDTTPRSQDWWLLRLGKQLRQRHDSLQRWRNYYIGEADLPYGPPNASSAYQDFQRKARTNICAPIVNADVHRTGVNGITGSDGRPDEIAWGWWRDNHMPARQKRLWRMALSLGRSYLLISTHPDDASRPLMTVEHPSEVAVERDPVTGRVAAAVKAWYDDIERVGRATVWTSQLVTDYTTARSSAGTLPWGVNSWDIAGQTRRNTVDEVPVVEFCCQTDEDADPEPDFARIMGLQDRVNLSVLNRMTAERYSAFRQKYVTGHRFRRETDPVTGLEHAVNPFKPDPGALWGSEGESTRFGEFSQTDLMPYLKVYEQDVRSAFLITATPAYYMPLDLVNVSTDTILALETDHIAKIREFHAAFGEGITDSVRISAATVGAPGDYSRHEASWDDPRQLNPAVIADQGSKLRAMGYPLPLVAERMGESPEQVQRVRTEAASEGLLAPAASEQADEAA